MLCYVALTVFQMCVYSDSALVLHICLELCYFYITSNVSMISSGRRTILYNYITPNTINRVCVREVYVVISKCNTNECLYFT